MDGKLTLLTELVQLSQRLHEKGYADERDRVDEWAKMLAAEIKALDT